MAKNLTESFTTEDSMPRQIMAQSEVVSDPPILQSSPNENIPTSIETMPQHSDNISTIATVSLNEEIVATVSLSVSDAISVSTQMNVISEREPSASAPEIGGQTILQTSGEAVMEEDSLEQASQDVSIEQEHIHVPIENDALNEGIQITNSGIQQSDHHNLPPWASRLHDWELIGDSYRGYVSNEVELDLILTLHKQHTNTCWGTRQSPSSAKPSIRLMWKSQYVPYDGIPFLNTGRRATVMECQYGPRRKGVITRKMNEYDEEGHLLKRPHRPTCPARIYIKKVRKFPEFRIDPNLEGKNVRQAQERALTTLRLGGVETGGEERFYVQLPLPIAHEYHDSDDLPLGIVDDNQGQRLNLQVLNKIQEFVARGLSGLYTIKHLLKEYVEKEMFIGQDAPPKHNKAYFPTIIDIQNHIHQAQMALASGVLLPLPPLTNIPIITSPGSNKDRARKRKNPEKLSQTSQTAEAVASIQHMHDGMSTEHVNLEAQAGQQDSMEQEQDNFQQQLEKIQSEGSTSGQQQILITPSGNMQMPTNKDGQVVIVVTSNNVFTTQSETETPTTFALTALPSSQITSLPHSSLGSFTTGSQAVVIAHGENGSYLTHAPNDNILTVLNPGLQGVADEGAVLRMMARAGQMTTAEATQAQPTVPEQLLASQAAVAAVLNAAAASVGVEIENKPSDQTHTEAIANEKDEGMEPPVKRQAIGSIDLASLVKEAVYDQQQMTSAEMSQSQDAMQTHVMTTAQLSAALRAQSTSALNTAIPIAFQDPTNSQDDQHVVTMVTQTGSENAAAFEGYRVIDIPSATAEQLSQSGYDVRDIDPVTMETHVAMEPPRNIAIETSTPVCMGTSQLVESFDMPKMSKSGETLTETMLRISSNLPRSEGSNNGISESVEVSMDSEETELDGGNASSDGSMDGDVDFSQAQACEEMEVSTSTTN